MEQPRIAELLVGLAFIAVGTWIVVGSLFELRILMKSFRARVWTKLIGYQGTRWFFFCVGTVAIAIGILWWQGRPPRFMSLRNRHEARREEAPPSPPQAAPSDTGVPNDRLPVENARPPTTSRN